MGEELRGEGGRVRCVAVIGVLRNRVKGVWGKGK